MAFLRRINTIQDVVDWGLCTGCGACAAACRNEAIELLNVEAVGIRPFITTAACARCGECVAVCPGYLVDSSLMNRGTAVPAGPPTLLGPTLEIWEGHAADEELRFHGSSGGVLSALALYCLEREGMASVLHTGMNPQRPWENLTVQSRTRAAILEHAGSRYAPSSPCEGVDLIEAASQPSVFIGKPCDAAGMALLTRRRPQLAEKLGLTLTFFCAGTPCTRATCETLDESGVDPTSVTSIRYRGEGWPGRLRVVRADGTRHALLTYEETWDRLQRQRPMRCHLCGDGVGEIADISCGDAWHRYEGETDGGLSVVLVRTPRGKAFLTRAREAGYLTLTPSTAGRVIAGQGLTVRRQELFGRLVALRLLGIPAPRYRGFSLFHAWRRIPLKRKVVTIAGTLRRFLQRGLWHRNPIPRPSRASAELVIH